MAQTDWVSRNKDRDVASANDRTARLNSGMAELVGGCVVRTPADMEAIRVELENDLSLRSFAAGSE